MGVAIFFLTLVGGKGKGSAFSLSPPSAVAAAGAAAGGPSTSISFSPLFGSSKSLNATCWAFRRSFSLLVLVWPDLEHRVAQQGVGGLVPRQAGIRCTEAPVLVFRSEGVAQPRHVLLPHAVPALRRDVASGHRARVPHRLEVRPALRDLSQAHGFGEAVLEAVELGPVLLEVPRLGVSVQALCVWCVRTLVVKTIPVNPRTYCATTSSAPVCPEKRYPR